MYYDNFPHVTKKGFGQLEKKKEKNCLENLKINLTYVMFCQMSTANLVYVGRYLLTQKYSG